MPRNDELVLASNAGDLARVRQLISEGADPNSVDQHGMGTLLTFHPEVTRFLLESGADPDVQRNENISPVVVGVCESLECLQLLLDAGADPTIRDANNDTPLSWASWYHRDKSIIDQLYYEGSGVGPDIPPSLSANNPAP